MMMHSRVDALFTLLLTLACGAGCGRDALIGVPSTSGQGGAAGTVPVAGGTGGSGNGNGNGNGNGTTGGGGTAGGGAPDARRPMPPPSPQDAAPAPPSPDAAPAACADVPPCLVKLASSCPTTGACTAARTPTSTNQCYANGVKVTAMVALQASAKVTRADGSLCYVVTGNLGRGGMGGAGASLTYSDSNAAVIATGTFQGGGAGGQMVVMCAGNNVPVAVPVACVPGASALLGLLGGGSGTCQNGRCP